jgi:hypothetical protein
VRTEAGRDVTDVEHVLRKRAKLGKMNNGEISRNVVILKYRAHTNKKNCE